MARLVGRNTYVSILFALIVYTLTASAGFAGNSYLLYASIAPGLVISLVSPGFLFIRMLGVTIRRAAETIIFSVGASIFLLMASGLAINTFLPLAGIDNPLDSRYAVSLVLALNVLLMLSCYLSEADLHIYLKPARVSVWVALLFILPPLFAIGDILGAVSLNNGGTNVLTMIVLAGIAALSLIILLLRKHVPAQIFPFSLYWICLALLLSMSLRGWLISGHDVLEEYSVFKLTHQHLQWNINYFRDAYNACLSITILPTIISGLMPKIPDQYIFRFVFQGVFALMPVGLYCFVRRYVKRTYAFITVLFFLSQAPLLRDFVFLTRQEMAIFFYMLMLLVMVKTSLSRTQRFALAFIFGLAMIWSHYSTTYIALGVFIIALILKSRRLRRIGAKFSRFRWPRGAVNLQHKVKLIEVPDEIEVSHLHIGRAANWLPGWRFVILLAILTLSWNTWITGTSDNLKTVTSSLWQTVSGLNGFWDFQAGAAKQFDIFSKPQDESQLITSYAATHVGGDNTVKGLPYLPDKYQSYDPQIDSPVMLSARIPSLLAQPLFYVGELAKKLVKVFIIIGAMWLISSKLSGAIADDDLKFLIEANIAFLILFIFMPLVSADYGLLRAYQQLLIGLALPAVAGSVILFKIIFQKKAYYACVVFFVVYFLFLGSFISQLIGMGYAQMQLNNYGIYYDIYYMHQAEDLSINWLGNHGDPEKPVFSDWFARKKIAAFEPRWIWAVDNVLPANITQDSYVFADETNKNKGAAYVFYQGHELNYSFPSQFLNQQKDTIYDNGKTKIMR